MLVDEPRVRRWTKDEYHQAADLGWFAGERVELVHGEVIAMAPQKDGHAYTVRIITSILNELYGPTFTILTQMPLNLGSNSEPEPDIAVVKGAVRELQRHPTNAELVIEVSDTTLAYDRGKKARLYAEAAISEYWIVNLLDRQIEVHRRASAGSVSEFAPAEIVRGGSIDLPGVAGKSVGFSQLLP